MAIENPSIEELGKILKKSKRIAVVGLSDNPARTSYMVSKAMQDAGYEIIPVNPMIDSALGVKALSSLKEIKEHVDIVNVFRRPEYLFDIAKDFLTIDADVYWTQQGLVSEQAYDLLTNNGHTVVMDRCIKVIHSITK
jgi:uncharacterized protein